MLWTPHNSFKWQLSSQDGVRPAAAYGDTITSGAANTKGSYVEIFPDAEIVNDVYGMLIVLSSSFASGTNRIGLTDIGVDTSGGTSYTAVIPDLLSGGVEDLAHTTGMQYYFPIYLPAGTAIAARWQCATATVTQRVLAFVFGKPTHPHLVRAGQKVTAYGITAASSRGTSVTAGGASEGSWTSLGTTSESHWYWQYGWGTTDTGTTSNAVTGYDFAYGDASTKYLLVDGLYKFNFGSTENHGGFGKHIGEAGSGEVASGDTLYARAQSDVNDAGDTGQNAAMYGVS